MFFLFYCLPLIRNYYLIHLELVFIVVELLMLTCLVIIVCFPDQQYQDYIFVCVLHFAKIWCLKMNDPILLCSIHCLPEEADLTRGGEETRRGFSSNGHWTLDLFLLFLSSRRLYIVHLPFLHPQKQTERHRQTD